MIRTVVREHHWSPTAVSRLYLDDIDFNGLEFWYEDVKETVKPKK